MGYLFGVLVSENEMVSTRFSAALFFWLVSWRIRISLASFATVGVRFRSGLQRIPTRIVRKIKPLGLKE